MQIYTCIMNICWKKKVKQNINSQLKHRSTYSPRERKDVLKLPSSMSKRLACQETSENSIKSLQILHVANLARAIAHKRASVFTIDVYRIAWSERGRGIFRGPINTAKSVADFCLSIWTLCFAAAFNWSFHTHAHAETFTHSYRRKESTGQ